MDIQNNDSENHCSSADVTLGCTSIRKRITTGLFILGILLLVFTFALALGNIRGDSYPTTEP